MIDMEPTLPGWHGDCDFLDSVAALSDAFSDIESSRPVAGVTLYPNGLRFSDHRRAIRSKSGGGIRGAVNGYSVAARRRQAYKWMAVDFSRYAAASKRSKYTRAIFLTITYPVLFPSFLESKRDLKVFLQRLTRSYWPVEAVAWKLEPQERGAPHYHLVIFFSEPVQRGSRPFGRRAGSGFIQWACKAWYEVVGSGLPEHRTNGAKAYNVYGHGARLMGYLVKYLGKSFTVSEDNPTGRCWGIWGQLPVVRGSAALIPTQLGVDEFMNRAASTSGRNYAVGANFSLYGEGWRLAALLSGMVVFVPGPGRPVPILVG